MSLKQTNQFIIRFKQDIFLIPLINYCKWNTNESSSGGCTATHVQVGQGFCGVHTREEYRVPQRGLREHLVHCWLTCWERHWDSSVPQYSNLRYLEFLWWLGSEVDRLIKTEAIYSDSQATIGTNRAPKITSHLVLECRKNLNGSVVTIRSTWCARQGTLKWGAMRRLAWAFRSRM